MNKVADLHVHTTYSDGVFSPEEMFIKAKNANLSAISFTDHDTIEGLYHGHLLKTKYGIDFINGIEISCVENGKEYHLLGYQFDLDNKELNRFLPEMRLARLRRAEQIVKKLNRININITLEQVIERAGAAPIARPHIAKTLTDLGFTYSIKDAFSLYIGDNKPAYEPKKIFPVERAIKLINQAGGIAVLAHPARMVTQEVLYKMIKSGLDGIEIVHPMHDESTREFYKAIANQYWLLETGGSDYHGNRDYDDNNFGKHVISYNIVESIRYRAGKG